MFYFPYTVEYYIDNEGPKHAHGFTFAETYADAVGNITSYYGEEEVTDIQITAMDTNYAILEVPNAEIKNEIIKHF